MADPVSMAATRHTLGKEAPVVYVHLPVRAVPMLGYAKKRQLQVISLHSFLYWVKVDTARYLQLKIAQI
jgi:hypothetical protein